MSKLDRYQESLRTIPPPGGGGCHTALLAVANYGILAGLTAERIFSDLRGSIPAGSRKVSDREISDAIRKAMQDHRGGTFSPRPRPTPVIRDGKVALQRIIEQGKIRDEADLWEASPIRLWEAP